MRPSVDPSELSAEQRLDELAEILAAGVLRRRKAALRCGRQATSDPKTLPESVAERLELSAETVLSVHTG